MIETSLPLAPAQKPIRLAPIALGLLLGAVILVVAGALMGVNRDELLKALAAAPLWAAPAAIFVNFMLFGLGAARWNRSMQPVLNNTFWQGYWAMLVSYPLNAVLPAKGGDLFRVNLLALRTGGSRATILGAEIMDKAMDLAGPMPVIALLLIFGEAPTWVASGATLMVSVLAGLSVFIYLSRRRRPSDQTWLSRAMAKLRHAYTGRSLRELAVTAFLVAPWMWIGESAGLFFIGNGFGIPLTVTQAFCVLVAVKVGTVAPTPGGIGSVEAAGAASLMFFGAQPAQAFAMMLIYRTSQLSSGSLVGAVFLAIPRRFGNGILPRPIE